MITDVPYSVNVYIFFVCVKHFELSCYGHYAIEVLCIIIIIRSHLPYPFSIHHNYAVSEDVKSKIQFFLAI